VSLGVPHNIPPLIFPDHQTYLDGYKQRYLTDAMALNKSYPDKGSGEYRRKLNELVSGYAADRGRMLIERSSDEYGKYIEEKSKKFTNNKYASHRDIYRGFKGLDANGNIIPFNYVGFSDKEDWEKKYSDAIKDTPISKISRDITLSNGTRVKVSREIKSPRAIQEAINAHVSPEAQMDMAEDIGLSSIKDIEKYNEQRAIQEQVNNLDTINQAESDANKRENIKFAKEQAAEIPEFRPVNVQNPHFSQHTLDNIDASGNIKGGMLWGTPSDTYTDNPALSRIVVNSKMFHKTGQVGLKALKNGNNTIGNIEMIPINDLEKGGKQRDNILEDLLSNTANLQVWDSKSQPVDPKEITAAILNKDKKVASTAMVAGRYKSDNPFAPEAYEVMINGDKYVFGLDSTDPKAIYNHAVNKAFVTKEFQDVPKLGVRIYVDPLDISKIKTVPLKK